MEPIIVSKEKCMTCLYGCIGGCDMYDELSKPADGEKCYNYDEADEDALEEAKRMISGDITIDDCIGWLLAQAENVQLDSPAAKTVKKTVDFLRSLQQKNEGISLMKGWFEHIAQIADDMKTLNGEVMEDSYALDEIKSIAKNSVYYIEHHANTK